MLAGLDDIKCRSRTFIKKFEHFLFGSLLHKISVDCFFDSEGGRRLRGSSFFLLWEAVSLQLGVVLVLLVSRYHIGKEIYW